jgi:4a-hydroxytetrahydrobiopterin dehydratase
MIMANKLSPAEIGEKIKTVSGWQLAENAIKKQFEFESFMPAVEFVNRVAKIAENMDHHPDISINYRRVTMVLSTHSAGGITALDFALAQKIDGAVSG